MLLELSEQLQVAQAEKGQLREKVDDVDQAVAQILGEIQKCAASCSHMRCGRRGHILLNDCSLASCVLPGRWSFVPGADRC